MNNIRALILVLNIGITGLVFAPVSRAEDNVTYIVSSDSIATANVEYYDRSERRAQQQVQLPWRTTATVADALSPTKSGAELRADWRGYGRWRDKYVTVAIYLGDYLLCESTLDVGNATCYGSVPHRNFPGTAGG